MGISPTGTGVEVPVLGKLSLQDSVSAECPQLPISPSLPLKCRGRVFLSLAGPRSGSPWWDFNHLELIVALILLVILQLSPFRLLSLLFPVLFSHGFLFSLPSYVLFCFALISVICIPLARSNLRSETLTHACFFSRSVLLFPVVELSKCYQKRILIVLTQPFFF